jgi:hypothetical protein
MKKIFTLIALLGLAFGANAQRSIDISATLTSPPSTSHIDSSTVLNFDFYLTNTSSTPTDANDSLVFAITLAGRALSFDGNAADTLYYVKKVMNNGDTVQVKFDNLKFTNYPFTSSGNTSICVVFAGILNRSNAVADNNTANNTSCNTIPVWGLNVPKVTNVGTLSVYPNPAQSNLNMDVNLNEGGNVTVNIVDVTGRIVLSENKGLLNAGEHKLNINTGNLDNGVYIYQLMVNGEMTTGRFSVSK